MIDYDKLASDLGDTFIDYWKMPPVDQWKHICAMLEEAGYEIVACWNQEGDSEAS
jgi:hypothetical protein